jgi:hypothetical protein
MRVLLLFALTLIGTAWAADDAQARIFGRRGGYYYGAPAYSSYYYGTPVYSNYYSAAPASFYSTPVYSSSYYYPSYGSYYYPTYGTSYYGTPAVVPNYRVGNLGWFYGW